MTNIKSWLDANGLTLNADKSRTMTFGNYDVDINVNGEPIKKCGAMHEEKTFNLLGMELDQKLNWNYHMDKVLNKIGTGKYVLRRHKRSLNERSKN